MIGQYLSTSDSHLGTEVVDGLRREASPPESCEGEQSWIIPILDYSSVYQLGNLPLADYSVVHIESTIFPLNWTIDVNCITQPIV